jgi:hypothetical protein
MYLAQTQFEMRAQSLTIMVPKRELNTFRTFVKYGSKY